MTKDKFRLLCEQVLIPRMGDLLHRQLIDVVETQDAMAGEILRLSNAFERLAAEISLTRRNADQK